MSPRLSVVIPTHNKLDQLRRTLAALRRQDLSPEAWDVLVVDDGSSDGTDVWLAGQAADWEKRLRIVTPEHNVGRAAARNLGGREATGDWILFLDDDIVAPPSLLTAHLERLAGRSGHGVIGLVRTAADLVDGPHFHYIDTRGVAKVVGDQVPARYLVTQNSSVPREDFMAIGGFDERFEAYGFEDMDLGFRLEDERGVVFLPLRDPVPVHVHHHGLDDWLAKKRECGHGPLQRIAERHPARLGEMGLDLVLDPPTGRAARWPVRLLRSMARGPLSAFLLALARRWPTGRASRPLLIPVYARLLDCLVLSAYCQGLTDRSSDP